MISIRVPDIQDAELLSAIGKKTFVESHGHSASTEDIMAYTTSVYEVEKVKSELLNTGFIYRLIYTENQMAGYSKIIPDTPVSCIPEENITKLDRLYLLREYYNLKLGWKLLDCNIKLSQDRGQQGMWLYSWIENKRAIDFYTKAGFMIVGHYDFKISDSHSNPNHIMYLKFK